MRKRERRKARLRRILGIVLAFGLEERELAGGQQVFDEIGRGRCPRQNARHDMLNQPFVVTHERRGPRFGRGYFVPIHEVHGRHTRPFVYGSFVIFTSSAS